MDSSYFLISNNTSTNTSLNNLNNDLEQSSPSSFNYDPFDGFSFLDQQGMRLYDYIGASSGGGGRNSPSVYQNSFDQLDIHHHHQTTHKSFPFLQTDPNQEDDDDLQGTLTSFVSDLGVESDAGYTSGVDLFATNTIDCSGGNSCGYNNFSDINNNENSNNNNISYNGCNDGDSNTSQAAKRSVLMNLLIDGSDVEAGYTSHNFRALPERITTQHIDNQLGVDGNWKITTE